MGNVEQPNRYWLSFVVTTAAKARIKQWFNTQDSEKILRLGKEIINRKLKQFNKPPLDPNLSLFKIYEGEKLSIRERENLIERVGNGSLNPLDVIKKVLPMDKIMKRPSKEEMAKEVLTESISFEEKPEILITGEKGHQTQIASCCMPTQDDSIIGYITRGRGVTIHKEKCKVLKGLSPERLIKTSWSTQKVHQYTVKLRLDRRSRIGLLRDVAEVFAVNQSPILDIEANEIPDSQAPENQAMRTNPTLLHDRELKETTAFTAQPDIVDQKAVILASKGIFSEETIQKLIQGIEQHLFLDVKETIGISFDYEDDIDAVRRINFSDADQVILVHEVWQPPIRGLLHYITRIKAAMPEGKPLLILLTRDAGQENLAVGRNDINYDVWKKAIFKLENSGIVVKRFI